MGVLFPLLLSALRVWSLSDGAVYCSSAGIVRACIFVRGYGPVLSAVSKAPERVPFFSARCGQPLVEVVRYSVALTRAIGGVADFCMRLFRRLGQAFSCLACRT